MVRIWCHCGLTQLYVTCGEWTSDDDPTAKDRLSCCQNQCPKLMSCNHRCSKTCHSGPCSEPSACKKRTKVHCPCKRRKEERQCHLLAAGGATVECDDECRRIKADAEEARAKEERTKREEEERQQKEELERSVISLLETF